MGLFRERGNRPGLIGGRGLERRLDRRDDRGDRREDRGDRREDRRDDRQDRLEDRPRFRRRGPGLLR